MENFSDAINVNRIALTRSFKSIKYLPIITFVLLISGVVNFVANYFLTSLSMIINIPFVYGIASYIVEVATLSLLVSCLSSVIRGSKLTLKNFMDDWQRYISPIMSIKFIIWLIEMAMDMVIGGINPILSYIVIVLVIAILESPMLETIYIGNEYGTSGFYSILDFLKNNIIQWLPVIVFTVLIYMLSTRFIDIFSLKSLSTTLIARFVISQILLAFLYIYKGHLFSILNNSSVRKRKFMGVFDR